MQEMITFANQLGELDTSGVEPMAHVIPISNVFRKDQPIPSFEREALLFRLESLPMEAAVHFSSVLHPLVLLFPRLLPLLW